MTDNSEKFISATEFMKLAEKFGNEEMLRRENESLKIINASLRQQLARAIKDNKQAAKETAAAPLPTLPVIHPSRGQQFQNRYSFYRFKQARIRREVGEKITLKEIIRAYKSYMEEFRQAGEKTLAGSELEQVINDEFGTPTDGKTFLHIRLFYSDEDAKAFDSENRVGE
jgi:hypothetical protein